MNKIESVTVTGFEGPEKRLEVVFKANPARPNGLRCYNKVEWQTMLDEANCTIISQTSNEHFDSYVLSESSLFVYPNKVMLKTCGTTTLLKVIPTLLKYASTCDLKVDLVKYSRKNFLFPELQVYPHNDWRAEIDYLDEYFDGQPYILGPLTKDHWYLYLADYTDESSQTDVTLEVMMHKLDKSAASKFYRQEGTGDRDKFPGVIDLIPGSTTDEFNFTPCGYSMNALCDEVYSTIHVTPEPHCSYASYESNVTKQSYKKLLLSVFEIFRPGTVTLTLFSEKTNSTARQYALDTEIPGYILKHKTISELGSNCEVILCNYELSEYSAPLRKRNI